MLITLWAPKRNVIFIFSQNNFFKCSYWINSNSFIGYHINMNRTCQLECYMTVKISQKVNIDIVQNITRSHFSISINITIQNRNWSVLAISIGYILLVLVQLPYIQDFAYYERFHLWRVRLKLQLIASMNHMHYIKSLEI